MDNIIEVFYHLNKMLTVTKHIVDDENHCVYLRKIGRHSEKKPAEMWPRMRSI